MFEINKIYNENCLDTMNSMPEESIDLTGTSPPYDDLRTYNGYSFDFENVAKGLFKVTKKGGVVVWVVGDQTKDGDKSGTSFRQALYFKEIGFKLHDVIIYEKSGVSPVKNRYYPAFEYMFVLSKDKIKTFNPICDRPNKWRERWGKTRQRRKADGTMGEKYESKIAPEFGIRRNIWKYTQGGGYGSDDKIAYKHPAIFPEKLAEDHILSWSNEGDLVYDPFMGSGTTAKMAKLNNRNYIGSEISGEYINIINNRLCLTQ
jgi:site-specific DNA-methyltransferase (adenine-specific)